MLSGIGVESLEQKEYKGEVEGQLEGSAFFLDRRDVCEYHTGVVGGSALSSSPMLIGK